ncbi:MAG: cytochrome c [Piscinibacter sp.]|uniref:c-type cytochrome n=1 Tax=Piscinibacter sp. TaxID=1903157 RepID=UPI003D1070D0
MSVALRALVAGVLAGAPALAAAQAASPETVEAGRKIYVSSCTRCHGINLVTNGIGFDLRTFPQNDKERFVRSVTNGKGAMPAWGATLKPEQIDLLWAYIGAVNGWKPAPQ